jgi:hypothetical protein
MNGHYNKAFYALFDKGKSERSGEAEYGGIFSLESVKKVLTKNPHLVPPLFDGFVPASGSGFLRNRQTG